MTYVSDSWPIFWDDAAGSNVRDADGNVFIDLTGAFGVALLGHRSRAVQAAIAGQSSRLIHGMGDVHPPTAKLAVLEQLADLAPWAETRVVLSSTGSEAAETALKTAQLATGKPGIIAFEGGYHGLTIGALAVTERPHFRDRFLSRLYDGVAFASFPDVIRDGEEAGRPALALVRDLLERGAPNGDPIGCLIVEPIQARGGVRLPPDGFMAALSTLVRSAGVLVIADEIVTGLGRCGPTLASSCVGLSPDIICLGKSLGGGLPLSACMAPAAVMDAWPESAGEAIHTSTFLGHPLACAAAVAVLDTVRCDWFAARVEEEGARLLAALTKRFAELPVVVDVRGKGLLLGIEFGGPDGRMTGAGARVAELALNRGLIVLPAGNDSHVLELTPPMALTDEQVTYVADALGAVIEQELGKPPF